MALPWGAPLTYGDLRELPDDGHRYELVDGTLLVTPAPGREHQRCVGELYFVLRGAAPPGFLVLTAPFDYLVDPKTLLQPDLLVARESDVGEARLEGRPPLLAVEVVSPSTRLADLGTKRLAYEAAGVPAYWVVDPHEQSLLAFRLVEERYVEVARVVGEAPYRADWPFEVTVAPALLSRPRTS